MSNHPFMNRLLRKQDLHQVSSSVSYKKAVFQEEKSCAMFFVFFFCKSKRVKPKSINDIDLTSRWRYSPWMDPLMGIQMGRNQQSISTWPAEITSDSPYRVSSQVPLVIPCSTFSNTDKGRQCAHEIWLVRDLKTTRTKQSSACRLHDPPSRGVLPICLTCGHGQCKETCDQKLKLHLKL